MAPGPLIVGATGQIGRAWQQGAVDVFEATPQFLGRRPGAAPVIWDILNQPAPDIDCSGIISLAGSNRDDAQTMIALAQAICDLGARLEVPVLLASTQAVYGPLAGPMSETSNCRPTNDYGRARREMEQAVSGRGRVTCLRIGNIPGADLLFRNARLGPVLLDRWPDGTGPLRSMIGLRTLARACDALLRMPKLPPVLNLAQPGLVSMEALLDAAGADWSWRDAGPAAVHRLELDTTLCQSILDLPAGDPVQMMQEARACGCWP